LLSTGVHLGLRLRAFNLMCLKLTTIRGRGPLFLSLRALTHFKQVQPILLHYINRLSTHYRAWSTTSSASTAASPATTSSARTTLSDSTLTRARKQPTNQDHAERQPSTGCSTTHHSPPQAPQAESLPVHRGGSRSNEIPFQGRKGAP
jgi:hypothetical protein